MANPSEHANHDVVIGVDQDAGTLYTRCRDCDVMLSEEPLDSDRSATHQVVAYVDKSMYEAEKMKSVFPSVHLLNATLDPLGSIAAACRMYEGKITHDLSYLSDDERLHYWEEVQKTHLKAPLEFVDLHFFIEGVTRAFTHQMVRQRTAVYAQESMRFAVKDKIAARPGPSIYGDHVRETAWHQAIEKVWETYNVLIANGVPAEDARGLLPHDTLTRLNYKTNLRNLLEHAGNRLCTQAQFEWRIVFAELVNAINEHHPNNWQWQHIVSSKVFKPVCFAVGHCPFTADFDRGCKIRPRVEEGRFDEITPAEYMADNTAAWQ